VVRTACTHSPSSSTAVAQRLCHMVLPAASTLLTAPQPAVWRYRLPYPAVLPRAKPADVSTAPGHQPLPFLHPERLRRHARIERHGHPPGCATLSSSPTAAVTARARRARHHNFCVPCGVWVRLACCIWAQHSRVGTCFSPRRRSSNIDPHRCRSMSTRSKRPGYGQLDPGSRRTSGSGNRLLAQCSYAVNVLLMLYFFHLSNQRVNRCAQSPLPSGPRRGQFGLTVPAASDIGANRLARWVDSGGSKISELETLRCPIVSP
jgi:hypothetical protein